MLNVDINVDRRTHGLTEKRTPISHPAASRCAKKGQLPIVPDPVCFSLFFVFFFWKRPDFFLCKQVVRQDSVQIMTQTLEWNKKILTLIKKRHLICYCG